MAIPNNTIAGMRAFLVVLLLAGAAIAEKFEFMVPKGKSVCFEDFISKHSSIIYGYTVFTASSLSDNLVSLYGEGSEPMPFSGGNRGRMLQTKRPTKGNKRRDPDLDDDLGDDMANLERFVEDEWNTPKASKKKAAGTGNKEAQDLGIAQEIGKTVGAKVKKLIAAFEIKSINGTLLSPKDLQPFTLKQLLVDVDFEQIEACVTNLHPTEELLVGLTWTMHFKSDAPWGDTHNPATKNQSDDVLQRIMGVENTLEHALRYYENIQVLEDHFIASGNSVLGTVFVIGLVMVFGYLAVGIILRIAVEKSLRHKKII